jgi:chromate transport protein ChrA
MSAPGYPVSGLRGCLVGVACCFGPMLLIVLAPVWLASRIEPSGVMTAALAIVLTPVAGGIGYALWRLWRRAACASCADAETTEMTDEQR